MVEYMKFWFSKFFVELIILFVLFSPFGIIFAKNEIKKLFCKHSSYYENMACEAICETCKKNLGFIGNLRNKHGNN